MSFWFLLSGLACQGNGNNDEKLNDEPLWNSAPLAELSGDCPDMTESDELMTINSSGESRDFRVIIPDSPEEPMNVLYFLHGFMDANPSGYWSNSLGMQSVANDLNTVIIMPESNVWNLMGQNVYMWDVEDGTFDKDLTLFDDLRTCTKQNFEVDLDKFSVMGISGGAMFTTVILTQRADTLASAVEFSGGADISVPLYENDFSAYYTPSSKTPTLMTTGGSTDVWPDPQMPIINFTDATDTLQSELVSDGHLIVRCEHNYGHTVTAAGIQNGLDWVYNHRYGEASPYADGINAWSNWCVMQGQ